MKPGRERPSKDVKIRMLRAAIVAACSRGPVKFGAIQRAVNIAAETFFGDISRSGTTISAWVLTMHLVNEGKLRMKGNPEKEPLTYEANEL